MPSKSAPSRKTTGFTANGQIEALSVRTDDRLNLLLGQLDFCSAPQSALEPLRLDTRDLTVVQSVLTFVV